MDQIIDVIEVYIVGPQGPAGTFASASAVPLDTGADPTVDITGPEYAKHIEFGLPAGPRGPKGDPGNGSVNSVNGNFGPDIELGPLDIGGAQAPTPGTIPVRGPGGVVPGVGDPVGDSDAVNRKVLLDNIAASDAKTLKAQRAALVRVSHRFKRLPTGVEMNVFTASTGGEYFPGIVSKRFSDVPNPVTVNRFKSTLAMLERGDMMIANASGWDHTAGGRIRGANIADGVAYGALSNIHPQDNAAIAYCRDGKLRYYEHALGDTVAKMLADGAVHSWSWGPAIIKGGKVHNYATSGGWAELNTTAKSARTILGQMPNGDIVLIQIYGATGSTGVTVGEAATSVLGEGLELAVLLDGGGSTQSAWNGKIAHVSSDLTTRLLPDFIAINAPSTNVMRVPPVSLPLKSPFTGDALKVSMTDGVGIVDGIVTGNSGSVTQPQLTEDGTMPPWIRNQRFRGSVRGGGGVIAMAKASSGGAIHLTTPAGINNPDVYIEFDANHGME